MPSLLVAAILIGCASPATTAPPGGSAQAAATTDVPVVPALDPNAFGLKCGEETVFHPSLLDRPGSAESDGDPVAGSLRDYLDGREGENAPRSGWIRVAQSATRALFLAPDGAVDYAVAGFAFVDGRWALELAGGCRPEVALPGGAERADWRLDASFPDPAPGDRTIHVLLRERSCAGGRSPEGRVLPPAVAMSPEAATIAIAVLPRPGANDCTGNPELAMAVELPEPLGDRLLFDGAVFPPAGPIATFELQCGEVEPRLCRALAQDIVANAERLHPGKGIVHVYVYGADGDYDLLFDDGTGMGADIN